METHKTFNCQQVVKVDKFDFSEKIGLEGVVNFDTIYSVFIFLGVKIYPRGV